MLFGVYIHIPFCRSRCNYCDFYTLGGNGAVPEAYIDALLRDYAFYLPQLGGAGAQPATVYFGGGTPGLLTPKQVSRVLHALQPSADAEITLETNPDLATLSALQGWRAAGINRLSLGVQTASNASLKRLGRPHTAQNSAKALHNAHKAGFANISGDIMLALPSYTQQEFDATLALLQNGGATHISAYLLKIEPNTPFGRRQPAFLPDADASADFYLYAAKALQQAGYARYELSNFAKPGFAGKHNQLYWDCRDVLGLGAGSHTLLNKNRFALPENLHGYMQGPMQPQPLGQDTAEDYIMLRLRLAAGLSEQALFARYGQHLTAQQKALLLQLQQQGLVMQHNGSWALTDTGLLVENSILAQLL